MHLQIIKHTILKMEACNLLRFWCERKALSKYEHVIKETISVCLNLRLSNKPQIYSTKMNPVCLMRSLFLTTVYWSSRPCGSGSGSELYGFRIWTSEHRGFRSELLGKRMQIDKLIKMN